MSSLLQGNSPSPTDLTHVEGLRGGVLDTTRTVVQNSITLE